MFQEGLYFLTTLIGSTWLEQWLLKSFVVLVVFLSIDQLLRARLASSVRSAFLLMASVCVFIQPFSSLITHSLNQVMVLPTTVFFTFDVMGAAELAHNNRDTLLSLYLLVVIALAMRLGFALWKLRAMKRDSVAVVDPVFASILNKIKQRLEITRPVALTLHAQANAPLSFGLFSPQIVMPVSAQSWTPAVIEHVLVHELVHIKRFDWLRVLLAYCVASLLWMNPLSWVLLARTRACTEDACDEMVVRLEGNGANYAQNLVVVARLCKAATLNRAGLAQSMLGHSNLNLRVQQILETKIMKTKALQNQHKKIIALSCVISAGLLLGMSGSNLVEAQNRQPVNTSPARSQEFLPVYTVVPYYPRKAADESIEGWAQVKFNVGTQGEVLEDSIEVVDAEPATIFDESAKAAIAQFRFTEYAPDGFPVIVPNVQYVFRYKMTNED